MKTCHVLHLAPSREYVWGSGGIAPCIFNPGTAWRWVVKFTARPLYPRRRSPRYTLVRWLCGPRAGRDAVAKKNLSLPGIESRPSIP